MAQTQTPPPGRGTSPEAARLDISADLLLENWRGELDAAALYRALARHERSEERAEVLLEIAQAEVRHAEIMATRLQALGVPLPKHRIGLRVRVLGLVARIFGSR